ncbi:MAG: SDR family NAD(P)-dependent oxidoreductase [Peptococcaceae bacterium]|nr:SDR family NAD(P)-dependent oxidoreductase [Peptococcaceae bacterium]
MNLQGKKILVTGADGFIGSHLTEELLRSGYSVRAFVFYNSFNSWGWLDYTPKSLQENLDIFPGDIRDPQRVQDAVKGCQVVIHLAALVAIPYSYHSPDTYVDTNIKGTLNILKAARNLGVEKVVHTSTSEVYGTARFTPIHEDHPLLGQSPYSATKIAADQMALAFYHSFETPVTIIRPFNTYGPRQSTRAVIPAIITQIAGGQRIIKLGSTHPTRDFSYVPDTVRGVISGAQSDAASGNVINLGTGFEISIGELVKCIAERMQVQVEIKSEAERARPEKSEVERLLSDNGKAKKLLGWEPSYAGYKGLQKGLDETIAWFSKSRNLKKYRPGVYNL